MDKTIAFVKEERIYENVVTILFFSYIEIVH